MALTYPTWLKPVAVKIGPLPLRWYALAYIAGLLLGWRYILSLIDAKMLRSDAPATTPSVSARQTSFSAQPATAEPAPAPAAAAPSEDAKTPLQRRLWGKLSVPITAPQLDDFLFYATLGVILGGRIGYILFYMLPSADERAKLAAKPFAFFDVFQRGFEAFGDTGWMNVFKIWEGGMSFHGGLIGVGIAMYLFARRNNVPLLSLGDLASAATPIGLFFGRLANFVNAELYGRATTVPWAMRFPIRDEHGENTGAFTAPVHPSQLYEATLEGLVLFFMLRVATHRFQSLQKPGLTMGIFLLGYGTFRLLVEFVREPDKQMPDFLRHYITMGMLLCLPMIALGAFLVWRATRAEATPASQPKAA